MTEEYRYIQEIINKSQWFYISKRHYNSSLILIVKNGKDDWTLTFLSRTAVSEIDEQADWGTFGDKIEYKPAPYEKGVITIPAEFVLIRKDFIFRGIENQYSEGPRFEYELKHYMPGRQVHGNLGAIIEEFQMLVDKAK